MIQMMTGKETWLKRLLPPYTSGSADTVFGVSVYGHRDYDARWFRWTVRLWHRGLAVLDTGYYWLIDRTISRHHIVHTGLKPGWHDVDELMFHACFALLGRFVEQELGPVSVDHARDHGHYRGYRIHCRGGTDEAAIDLWLWFHDDLPGLTAQHWAAPYDPYDRLDTLKQAKLDQLMRLRSKLWT